MVASYTQLFPYASKISDKFASGFRVALGFYAAKELFSKKWPFVNITNANYFVVSSIQATMNFAPSKGVFSISFGPEVQLAFGHSKPIFYAGLNALFQMRFNLSEKHSVGLSIGNHFYFYPQTLNLYDMRVSFSMVL